ncbi:GNAT family N-acetyltransferase [Pseudonocardia sp. CA-107938]|uniref:bifunctional acetate--CoA ligase family protein/GNAT family N-acetyltransferase n=1 Tax=Pseudonocardia sp. CA-107938 TaxID=3240021 RepID=UPI003D9395CB
MPTDPMPEHRDAQRRLLSDGATVTVARLGPADRAAVARLHADLPLTDRYLRFFGVSTAHDDELAERVVGPGWTSVGAFEGNELIGVAHFCHTGDGDPELAVAVAHAHQHRGVGSLLLQELVGAARAAGIPRLSADVLTINHGMIDVLDHLGLTVRSHPSYDVREVTLSVPPAGTTDAGEHYAGAVLDRAIVAEVAGLRAVLRPRSVAVIGAGHRPTSVGRLVLRRIIEGGYTGTVEVVAPHSAAVAGIPARREVEELPEGIDLAVLCVPADAVPDTARRCGERGIRALLVITSGLSATSVAELQRIADRHGMRIVGPNCLGLVNTEPDVRLQATFGAPAAPGCVGLAVQSGGVAIAVTEALNRLGLGVSSSVSLGDAVDVGAADLAAWWGADERTAAAVLYLESMPRVHDLARHLSRLATAKPIVAVRSGSSAAAVRAAASHTAASATPRAHQEALFARCGVLAVDDLDDVPGLLALLIWQPPVAGRRVAVVSNAGGLGVLAADACAHAGLDVCALPQTVQRALTTCLPAGAAVANPVDATATVPPTAFADAVDVLLTSPSVDAVIVLAVATAEGDPLAGFTPRAVGKEKPLVVVRPSVGIGVARRELADTAVPEFAEAAAAARALATVARRARWLRADRHRTLTPPPDVRTDVVEDTLLAAAGRTDDGWLSAAAALAVGRAAGLPLTRTTIVDSAQAAERAWRELGCPVAVKADAEGLVHKSAGGGVHIGLDSRAAIRAAVRDLRGRFGSRLRGIVVQPMVDAGTELLVGAVSDPVFGSLLTVGLGGTATDLVDDRSHCAVPPTAAELDHLLDGLRCAPRLLARPDADVVVAALHDAAARISWLIDRFPQVVEVEVNPLVVSAGRVHAVDLRIRVGRDQGSAATPPGPEPTNGRRSQDFRP